MQIPTGDSVLAQFVNAIVRANTVTDGYSFVLHLDIKQMKWQILTGNRSLAQLGSTVGSGESDYR